MSTGSGIHGLLFPRAPGAEQPPRPRSTTIVSYALFASAGIQVLGFLSLVQDPEALRAAAQSGLLPASVTYLWWLMVVLIGISCGYLLRVGSNSARLVAIAWYLFGAVLNSLAAAMMGFRGIVALIEPVRWVFVGAGVFFLMTPKALAFFADRSESWTHG